ncbi:MAG: threonine synthase [Pseudomonadota bacterium]|nr:threonine synthase [Pseudomonadota bacterium]
MHYLSTRGQAPRQAFVDAMLSGLARDGGLYTPEAAPTFAPAAIRALSGLPYAQAAAAVMAPFVAGAWSDAELGAMTEGAYREFRHAARAPLTQLDDNLFLLELFHGPTLAFKDFAMQFLGRAMNRALADRGARATILGATSGDTGAAAIEAFGGGERTDVFILFPHGRVSEVQRRQMTCVDKPGVHALAIDGSFDDCQDIVKSLFGDLDFRDRLSLSGVNSINWARILAQIVYYFTAAVSLGAPDRRVSFAVPTGNFGDVLAGWWAKRMGLPVERLIVATNENDILARALATGEYRPAGVKPTQSPSMDIQVSSNFERLLFERLGRDDARLRGLMASLKQSGGFAIPADALSAIRAEFDARRASEDECAQEMARACKESGVLIDPHTAVGVHAARAALQRDPATPVVALATAHPAKFPDAVEKATGVRPALPAHLADLLGRRERVARLPNDPRAVADYVAAHARARA